MFYDLREKEKSLNRWQIFCYPKLTSTKPLGTPGVGFTKNALIFILVRYSSDSEHSEIPYATSIGCSGKILTSVKFRGGSCCKGNVNQRPSRPTVRIVTLNSLFFYTYIDGIFDEGNGNMPEDAMLENTRGLVTALPVTL